MQEQTVEIKVGAVIWATGWKPYDAAKIQPYGYDRFRQRHHQPPNSNAWPDRTAHRRQDPASLGWQGAKDVAFIQCAGSRDENHLRHCSRICCMASLKQTQYVREAWGDAGKSTVYYIDIRAIDRLEDFLRGWCGTIPR